MATNLSLRRVYWATQETVKDWQPSTTNTAGSYDIATDGSLVCGKRTKNATLIWTTTDLWSMTFIGLPFVYSFRQEGTNCGIVSQQAAVVLDSGAYWMGINKFHLYNGYVSTIPCEVNDFVFGNFKSSISNTVFAVANPSFSEITWYYPSNSAGSGPDSYVTYNYTENHWVFGTLSRQCGITKQPGATTLVPVLMDASGHIFDHETGNTRTGGTPFLESGPIEIGQGDKVMRAQRIVPDDKSLGDVTMSLYTSFYPDAAETLNGPYTLGNPTSIRLTARQIRLRFTEAIADAWRVGQVRLGIILGGRR